MTTPYEIKIAPAAYRQFLHLPPKTQKDLIKMLEALSINPRPPGAKKIDGLTGLYTDALNNVRLIYKIEDQVVFLLLIKQ